MFGMMSNRPGRTDDGTFQAHKRQKKLAKASFGCYPVFRSGAMGRLLVLLLLAVALMAPTSARSSVRTDTRIEVEASAAQLAAPSKVKRMAVPCRGCTWKACGVSAIGCSAYCAVANALLPVTDVLATITPTVTGPFGISA